MLTYAQQLKMLASEHRVDLYDAMRKAGLARTTWYRSIAGDKEQLTQRTAELLERTIKEMSAR